MILLSHRGYWRTPAEKNSEAAFRNAWSHGFGIETDIRDARGELVISHDPPTSGAMSADRFFALYAEHGAGTPLALNVKADGLEPLLSDALTRHGVTNCFVFDMSVPDALPYLRIGLPPFTRQSEYERVPSFYQEAAGIWLDAFQGEWLTEGDLSEHRAAGKRVCLVSPELHRRPHLAWWRTIRQWPALQTAPDGDEIMLCTDFPEEARRFFDGAD